MAAAPVSLYDARVAPKAGFAVSIDAELKRRGGIVREAGIKAE